MDQRINRRTMIAGIGELGLGFGLTNHCSAQEPAPTTTDEAFEQLRSGNARFAQGKTRHAHESANWRKHLVGEQKPFATILGCSDSRVPPELVFDQGLGDLLVIRVAGNVISPGVTGSFEYALEHLGTRLIVVLGHAGCGAVTAALEATVNPAMQETPAIRTLLKLIEPGIKNIDLKLAKDARVAAGVEANVRWSLQQLKENATGRKLLADKKIRLVGGVYDLDSGLVRFLEG